MIKSLSIEFRNVRRKKVGLISYVNNYCVCKMVPNSSLYGIEGNHVVVRISLVNSPKFQTLKFNAWPDEKEMLKALNIVK